MRRSLRRIYWIGVAVTLVMAIAAVSMMVVMKVSDTRENLRSILEAASAWTVESTESLQDQADNIASVSPPIRVTFMMPSGLVLADSEQDPFTMSSHADRRELIEALIDGEGESFRLSGTKAMFVLYAAKRISPQLVLRLGYPIVEITRLLMFYSIGMLLLLLVLSILQRAALSRFVKSLTRQMDDVRRLLEGDLTRGEAVFPELKPAINNIAYLAERLREDVKEVNRTLNLRSDFVANASHELRSPLTSIMGFAEMLDEGLADTPEEQELCLKTIRSECRHMLDVIEDILLLSRAEKQQPPEASLTDVRMIAEDICQALSFQATQKGVTLRAFGECKRMAIEKDIWEILYNLSDNAIRYGRAGGHVSIHLSDDSITVEDDGIGIDDRHLPHILSSSTASIRRERRLSAARDWDCPSSRRMPSETADA